MPVILHDSAGQRSKLISILARSSGVVGDIMAEEQEGMLAVGAPGIIGRGCYRRFRQDLPPGVEE